MYLKQSETLRSKQNLFHLLAIYNQDSFYQRFIDFYWEGGYAEKRRGREEDLLPDGSFPKGLQQQDSFNSRIVWTKTAAKNLSRSPMWVVETQILASGSVSFWATWAASLVRSRAAGCQAGTPGEGSCSTDSSMYLLLHNEVPPTSQGLSFSNMQNTPVRQAIHTFFFVCIMPFSGGDG